MIYSSAGEYATINYAPNMHPTSTQYAFNIHPIFIKHAPNIYPMFRELLYNATNIDS